MYKINLILYAFVNNLCETSDKVTFPFFERQIQDHVIINISVKKWKKNTRKGKTLLDNSI